MTKPGLPSSDEKVALLAQVPLFAGLTAEQRLHLVDRAKTRSFPPRTIVVCEGDLAETLFVIAAGSVKVYLGGSSGEEISLGVLGPASVVGEMAVLDQHPRSASVITLEPTTMIEIGRPALETAIREHPPLAMMMMKHLAGILRRADAHIRTLSIPDAETRILRALVVFAGERGNGSAANLLVAPRPTNLQIAERVACRPETVSRMLKSLRDGRMIDETDAGIRVTRRALEVHADALNDLF